jgi:hypothetical protein
MTIEVEAAHGKAVPLEAGSALRVTTPKGAQAADFFAFTPELDEWLSPMHTWVWTRSVRPRLGDVFLTQRRRPLIRFAEDGAGGVHDMLIAACDQARYEQLGWTGPHRSCAENLREALAELGAEPAVTPQPVNLFTNTRVTDEQVLESPPNPVASGAFVVVEAVRDAMVVVSSCPFDLPIEGWTINAPTGPTELLLEVAAVR